MNKEMNLKRYSKKKQKNKNIIGTVRISSLIELSIVKEFEFI